MSNVSLIICLSAHWNTTFVESRPFCLWAPCVLHRPAPSSALCGKCSVCSFIYLLIFFLHHNAVLEEFPSLLHWYSGDCSGSGEESRERTAKAPQRQRARPAWALHHTKLKLTCSRFMSWLLHTQQSTGLKSAVVLYIVWQHGAHSQSVVAPSLCNT